VGLKGPLLVFLSPVRLSPHGFPVGLMPPRTRNSSRNDCSGSTVFAHFHRFSLLVASFPAESHSLPAPLMVPGSGLGRFFSCILWSAYPPGDAFFFSTNATIRRFSFCPLPLLAVLPYLFSMVSVRHLGNPGAIQSYFSPSLLFGLREVSCLIFLRLIDVNGARLQTG